MWRKNCKNKTANEWIWNIYSCKNNSQIWIVQPEFANWKCKAKLSAEAASGGVFKKAVRKNFAIFTGNTCVEVVRFKNIRSSHQRGSMKKCVLRNFTKFAGKHMCQSIFFNKRLSTLLKKRLWRRCFPVNFAKFLRTSTTASGTSILKTSANGQEQSPEMFCKKVYLEISQNSQENTCSRVSFLNKVAGLVFSCDFCEFFF